MFILKQFLSSKRQPLKCYSEWRSCSALAFRERCTRRMFVCSRSNTQRPGILVFWKRKITILTKLKRKFLEQWRLGPSFQISNAASQKQMFIIILDKNLVNLAHSFWWGFWQMINLIAFWILQNAYAAYSLLFRTYTNAFFSRSTWFIRWHGIHRKTNSNNNNNHDKSNNIQTICNIALKCIKPKICGSISPQGDWCMTLNLRNAFLLALFIFWYRNNFPPFAANDCNSSNGDIEKQAVFSSQNE